MCVVPVRGKIIACFLDVKELGLCAKREEMLIPEEARVEGAGQATELD